MYNNQNNSVMKKKNFFWSLMAFVMTATLSVGLTSCNDDDDEPDSVSVSMPAVNFGESGGSQVIQITSNAKWTISGAPTWLTVAPMQGSGNGSISINASTNTEKGSRNCTLFVNAGSASTMIMVTQSGKVVDNNLEGSYVGTLKPMGYTDNPAPCYVTITKLSSTTFRLTSLICETFGINVTQGLNLVAKSESDGRIALTSETTYVIEGNYFQGNLTLNFSIGNDNFFFSGVKSN